MNEFKNRLLSLMAKLPTEMASGLSNEAQIMGRFLNWVEEAGKDFPQDDFAIKYAEDKWGYQVGDPISNPEHLIELLNKHIQHRDEWFDKWLRD